MLAITADRKKTLFWGRYQQKIAFSYLAVIILMLVMVNTYPILVSQQFVFKSKETGMTKSAQMIASPLANLEQLSTDTVEQIMRYLDEQGQLVISDEKGAVVYDSTEGEMTLLPEIEDMLDGKNILFHSVFAEGEFQSRVVVPIISSGRVLGMVFLYEYDSEQAQILQRFQTNITNMSVGITLVVVVISLFVSSALTKRVSELLRAIKLAREGNFNHIVPVRGRDELAELADAFNSLAIRIKETDSLRRQFVSDASHELRTPLASMRLLADSIILTQDMPLPHVREFVGDIGDEIDRLTRMTEKLMLLTKLDSKFIPNVKRIDMSPLIMRARHMLMPLADAKQVVIRCELDETCSILAEEDDIYQALFNLMENAIKYNKNGGEVSIFMFKDGEHVIVHVDDTGIGIPDEDIPRLFERFYRVDKTRAREAGGAGLGLSIVNDMVSRYGGKISVNSVREKGTRFTVAFPELPEIGLK